MRLFILTFLILLLGPFIYSQNTSSGTTATSTQQAVRLSFNSPYAEYSPVLSWDGKLLYFARDGAPDNLGWSNHSDIWYARREADLSWSPAVNIGRPLNNEGHNIPMALSPLQDQLYIARKGTDQNFEYLLARAQGRMWEMPAKLHIPWLKDGSFPTIRLKGFQLSYDQQVLLFLAETPDGCGQLDVYASLRKENGQWAFPFNIGPVVNSEQEECAVFLASDNHSLYFASNGHKGLGGYDLYLSRRQDDSWLNWSTPVNLGAGVNTTADEQYPAMSMIGDELFFSRSMKDGASDLFSYLLVDSLRPLTRHIIHGETSSSKEQTAFPLQVRSIPEGALPVIQSFNDKYLTVVPPGGAYLFYQPSPKGFFAESLPFFQKVFFDQPSVEHWNALLGNKDYQERETHIEQLKNRKAQLIAVVQEKEAQLYQDLEEVKVQMLTSLEQTDWGERRQEPFNRLRAKYQQLSTLDTAADTTAQQGTDRELPPDDVVGKYDHFKKQKERLRRQLSGRNQIDKQGNDAAKLTPKGLSIVSFEQMLRNLYESWLSETLVSQWKRLEEQRLEGRLQQLSDEIGKKMTERLLKIGLSEELEQVSEESFSGYSGQLLSLSYPWQRAIREEVARLLQPAFSDRLLRILQPQVDRVLDEKILLSTQKYQDFLLSQEIQSFISMQVAAERNLPSLEEPGETELYQNKPRRTNGALIQEHDFKVVPLQKGQTIPFPGIVFEPNLPGFSPESEPEVNRLIHFLKEYPDLVVEIGVYSYGSILHSTALELSSQRAELLGYFIASRGVSPDRLIKKGYGKKEIVDYKYTWRNNIVVIKLIE
jgi:outer membrane protein OmpA-like peptidoglycan-associated protein